MMTPVISVNYKSRLISSSGLNISYFRDLNNESFGNNGLVGYTDIHERPFNGASLRRQNWISDRQQWNQKCGKHIVDWGEDAVVVK